MQTAPLGIHSADLGMLGLGIVLSVNRQRRLPSKIRYNDWEDMICLSNEVRCTRRGSKKEHSNNLKWNSTGMFGFIMKKRLQC